MLQLIKNNNPLTVIILLIYALAVNWYVLFHPQMPAVPEGDFLFHIITNFLAVVLFRSPFAFTFLSVVMLAIQGFYLNAMANRHKLFAKSYYTTAFVYISLASLNPSFTSFSQPLLVNWVLLFALDNVLQLAQAQKPRKLIYNTAFWIGVGALLMFPAIGYMLWLLMALSLLRNVNIGEWIVAFLGLITPVYFGAGMLYLFDVLHWLPGWVNIGFNLPRSIQHPLYFISALTACIILFSVGTYALQKQMSRVSVFTRRGWTAIAMCLIVSVIVATFTRMEINAAWMLLFPALSLVVSNAYYGEKNRAFSNFAFYFTLIMVVFCKLTLNY